MNIRKDTAIFMMKCFEIEPEITSIMFDIGLLNEKECKKTLIKNEYNQKRETQQKTQLKYDLADKYCLSIESIRKYVEGL